MALGWVGFTLFDIVYSVSSYHQGAGCWRGLGSARGGDFFSGVLPVYQ